MASNTTYKIEIDALASFNGNDAPQFLLLVDGQQVGTGVVDSNNLEAIDFTGSFASGQAHTISIVYTNHTASSQLLNVQGIAINGQTISSSDPGEVYTSPNGTFHSFGQMYFGGQIDFAVPASVFGTSSGSEPTSVGGTTGSGTSTGTGTGTGTGTAPGTTPGTAPGTAPGSVTIGSGSDTLALLVAEDAYNGDAQFTVSIDGVQVGGVQTVTANHAAGQTQTFNVLGTFGVGSHTVAVNFLNDAYGGSATTDRNLYVTGASINGATVAAATLNEYADGAQSFTFQNPTATPTPSSPAAVTIGSGADTLSLSVAEDAYAGDAQFTISVDGVQQGGVQTVTASHAAGQTQTFNVLGTFGAAQHTVTVNFLNDAYGGSAATDRNLYVTGASLNGQALSGAVLNEYSAGPQSFTFGTTVTTPTPTPTPTPAPTPSGPAFYVSPTGSNGGDGSAGRPFATIQYALSQMELNSVHTLYLQGGTYAVGSTVTLGSADSGDTILAAAGATPVLNATNGTATILSLAGAQNVTLSGLTLQNAGNDPQGAALLLSGSNGDTITGNRFTGNGEAVLLTNSSSNSFGSNTILNSATSAVEVKDSSNGNTFTNNVINGVGALNLSGGGFYVHGGSNDTFSNNVIENTAGTGIAIEDFGYGTTTNVGNMITRNEILNTSTSTSSTDDGAIYLLGRSDNDMKTTISMNFISGAGNVNAAAHVEGIYLDDNASGVAVSSNIVSGVQSDATELHGGYGDSFTNNIFDLGTFTRTAALIQQPEADRPANVQPALSNDVYSQNIIVSQQANPYYVYVYFDPQAVNVPIHGNLYYDPNIPAGGLSDTYGVYFNPNTPAGGLPLVSPVNDSSPAVGNPNFVASTLGSYGIGTGSAASLIGFTPIDTSLIGPH